MKNIILCSSNSILVKSLYGMLRDEGHTVQAIEHPSFAVQMVLHSRFDLVIIDSEPFGLSAEDAADIIRTVAPAIQVMFVHHDDTMPGEGTIDLEEFKKTITALRTDPATAVN